MVCTVRGELALRVNGHTHTDLLEILCLSLKLYIMLLGNHILYNITKLQFMKTYCCDIGTLKLYFI